MATSPSNERFEQALVAALERAWDEGSPVAGSTAEDRQAIAAAAVRRIRSFARREIPDKRARQVNDLAAGLVARCERRPDLVGPLMGDYRFLAAALLVAWDETTSLENYGQSDQ